MSAYFPSSILQRCMQNLEVSVDINKCNMWLITGFEKFKGKQFDVISFWSYFI